MMKTTDQQSNSWPSHVYIIIPAYKAATQLAQLIPTLLPIVPHNKICIIDDGSHDKTEEICTSFNILCLSQHKNQGKGAALAKGFSYLLGTDARWILTMDADGQHAVDDIRFFIDMAEKYPKAGIIGGARKFTPASMPLARIFSNRITSTLLSFICHKKIQDSQCGFRLYSIELLKSITLYYKRFEMESEIILKASYADFPILFVPIQTVYGNNQSHISHLKDMFRWVRAVIAVWIRLERKQSS